MENELKKAIEVSNLWEVKQVTGYFIMWSCVFIASNILIPVKGTRKHVADIHSRFVALLHGVVSFFFSTYFLCTHPFNLEMDVNFFASKIVVFSLGYFLYDLLVCVPYDLVDKKLLIHHLACWTIFAVILYTQNGIYLGIGTLSFGEASNFPLGSRAILRLYGLRHTLIYELTEAVYFILYIITRAFMSPVMFYFAVRSERTPVIVKIAVGLVLVQSLFFVKIMAQMIKKKYLNYIERKEKKVQLNWFKVTPDIKKLNYVKKKKDINLF